MTFTSWKCAAAVSMACLVAAAGVLGADAPAQQPPIREATDAISIKGVPGVRDVHVEFKMVQLPPGKITLKDAQGKDKTHEVKPIWIGKTEVTWPEYDVYWVPQDVTDARARELIDAKLRPSRPYLPPYRNWGNEGMPAGSIHLNEAQLYVKWLSQVTGKKYRLPTEAEWEYACRAGKAEGSGAAEGSEKPLKERAWFEKNSDDQPHPVATKHANPWGLHDMLGNVAEWVQLDDGTYAVAGGAFKDEAKDVHPARREKYSPDWQIDPQDPKGRSWLSTGAHVGLRVVREE